MKTSTELALEWLPRMLGDEPLSLEFRQELATELLEQSGARERLELTVENINKALAAYVNRRY